MPWPFSRREPPTRDGDAANDNGRRTEAPDAAAAARAQSRRRLIGAAVLLVAAVVFVPMLLDPAPRRVPENLSISVASQKPPAQAQADRPPVVDDRIAEPAPPRSEAESAASMPAATKGAAAATAPPAVTPAPAAATTAPPAEPARPPESAGAPQPAAGDAPRSPPAPAKAVEKVVVQVAALSTPAAADELVARLILDGYKPYVEAVPAASGTLHRVRVGPFTSREQAQRAANRLKAGGYRATVVGG